MTKPIAALTIAGSDPSGGAGIQQDLETFHLCKVRGLSAMTVVTAQTSRTFLSLYPLPKKLVASQLNLLFEEYDIRAAKTGLLYKRDFVELLLNRFKRESCVKLVVDPIMKATLGRALLQPKAFEALKKLIGKSYVVTPNLDEAGVLTGTAVKNLEDMKEAAKRIHQLGACYVIIKGGHLMGDATDLLYDGKDCILYTKKRVGEGVKFHGLGCRFSAALTAFLSQGESIYRAFELAEDFMTQTVVG